ncbi:MAG TPA: hypothetical protein VL171_04635 [Verrucomicrobiae bacterium]|nr:hypothetical protein [Verrucomicrobiae bacterium]
MSAVDENIVREYFEAHGFLVCQRRKYIVQTRQKTGDEEVDLIVLNPRADGEKPADFEITSETLGRVGRAIVAVKGWHTETFAPGVLTHQPEIFRFVEKRAVEEAQRLVGAEGLVKILVVPGWPRDAKVRARSIEVLKSKGVDGVISFRAILQELIAGVKTNRNYQKSDLLQILRLLKNYELLKEPQMELKFSRKGAKAQRKKA